MDLLDVVLGADVSAREDRRRRIAALKRVGGRSLVAAVEREVRRRPLETITFDSTSLATVTTTDHEFCGGRFATPSIGELRASVARLAGPDSAAPTLSVVEGGGSLTDIGALQAMAPAGTLFQVASQFNCLEAPSPHRLATVAEYLDDPTQGPRAAVSAFPAALVRHYAAPDGHGGRFTQTDDHQINLLAEALPVDLGRVTGGYLRTTRIPDAGRAAAALEQNLDLIRVGVHDEAPVVLGADWDRAVDGEPRIAQVFTSTLASGMYGRPGEVAVGDVERLCRQLLRAAYLGTLLVAVSLGKTRVVLTMIGGGVFGNPHRVIVDSVIWAVDQLADLGARPLQVVLNRRSASADIGRDWLREQCEVRGGVYRAV